MILLPLHRKSLAGKLKVADILDKATSTIISGKLYLNPELKCRDIAKAIGTNRTYIWQAIRLQGGGLQGYLARFRLNYFIRNAPGFIGLRSVEIAERCGFNDRKSLNKYLKRALGFSLAEYMRLIKQGL